MYGIIKFELTHIGQYWTLLFPALNVNNCRWIGVLVGIRDSLELAKSNTNLRICTLSNPKLLFLHLHFSNNSIEYRAMAEFINRFYWCAAMRTLWASIRRINVELFQRKKLWKKKFNLFSFHSNHVKHFE